MLPDQALKLKQKISSDLLRKKARSFAFSYSGPEPAGATALSAPLLQRSINGVGISERSNGESYIKVLTREPSSVSPSSLAAYFGVKRTDLVIETIGAIRFMQSTGRHRPPFPGISVGHYQTTAGTLGCFVEDNKGKVYILSNNHILADCDKGCYDDPILQPGKLDGGKKVKDAIAQLKKLVPLNRNGFNEMDAAIALLLPGIGADYRIGQRERVSGTIRPLHRLKVEKYGRTTGHTAGSITTLRLDFQVEFDGETIDFQDQFEIKGAIRKGRREMFCNDGDSGALILEKGTQKAVGLLFAGNEEGTTFATSIGEVLSAFSVKIL